MFKIYCELNQHIQREAENFLGEYRALLEGGFQDKEKAALLIINIKILISQIDAFVLIFRIYAKSASTIKCREIERVIDDHPESVERYDEATALKRDLTVIEEIRCQAQVGAVKEALGKYKLILKALKEQLQAGIRGEF